MKKLKNFLLAIAILTITGSSVNCAFQRKVNGRSINGPQEDTDQLRSNVSIQLHSSGRNTGPRREFPETELDQHPAEETITVEPIVEEPAIEESNELTEEIQFNFEHFTPTPTYDLRSEIWRKTKKYTPKLKEFFVRTLLIMKRKSNVSTKTFIAEENMITLISFYIEHYSTTDQEIIFLRNKIKTFSYTTISIWKRQYLNSYIGQNFLEKLENIIISRRKYLERESQELNQHTIEEKNELLETIQINHKYFIPTPTEDLIYNIWRGRNTYPVQFKELVIRTFLIMKKKSNVVIKTFVTEENMITLINFYIEHYSSTDQEINILRNKIKTSIYSKISPWKKQYLNSDIGLNFLDKLENILYHNEVSSELLEAIKFNVEHFTRTPTDNLKNEVWRNTTKYTPQFKEFITRTFLIMKKESNVSAKTLTAEENMITLVNYYIEHYNTTDQEINILRNKIKTFYYQNFYNWEKQYLDSYIGQNFLEKLENINLISLEIFDLESKENLLIPVEFDINKWHTNQL